MSGRIVTAGVRGESPAVQMTREHEMLGRLYGCLADVFLLANQVRTLTKANTALEPKLLDPVLRDHPKRPDHVKRFHARELEIRVARAQVEPYLRELATIWQRLPDARKVSIRTHETGWPDVTAATPLAQRVFDWMASDAFLWPGKSEAPFLIVCGVVALLRAGIGVVGAS